VNNIEYIYNEIKAYLTERLDGPPNMSFVYYKMNGIDKPNEARILFYNKSAISLKLNTNKYISIKDKYVYKIHDFDPIPATENWSRCKVRTLDDIKSLFPVIAKVYNDYTSQNKNCV
jgi:hypothetical protein